MKHQKIIMAATIAALCTAFSPFAQAADVAAKKAEASAYAGDAVITTKVKAALLKEQSTRSLSIKVTTNNGVVDLSGKADDSEQIDSAIRTAKAVDGVQDVKNDLQLKAAK